VTRPLILVVEDEPAIRDSLQYALEKEGYRVEAVETAAGALERARAGSPDLLLLDLMLPDGSGLDVCRTVRAESDVPIIILTARGIEADRVLGLEVGADDYVVKPFSVAELVGRVRAQLRRRRLDRDRGGQVVTVGDLRVDLLRQEVSVAGRPVSLTPAEVRLITALAREPERAFTRAELMAVLWDTDTSPASRACDTHVLNLRRKLGRTRARIETVRGVGYRLRVV
jgi:DNA-binding response OmpR family regulator